MIDKPRDVIMGAMTFFGDAHPTREMLIKYAALADPRITHRTLNRTLTRLVVLGEIVAYEEGNHCLFRKAEVIK